jgi:hypothetical protein
VKLIALFLACVVALMFVGCLGAIQQWQDAEATQRAYAQATVPPVGSCMWVDAVRNGVVRGFGVVSCDSMRAEYVVTSTGTPCPDDTLWTFSHDMPDGTTWAVCLLAHPINWSIPTK